MFPCLGQDAPTYTHHPDLVGLTVAAAMSAESSRGFSIRVVGRDGECLTITADFRTDRVNPYVVDDHVVRAEEF